MIDWFSFIRATGFTNLLFMFLVLLTCRCIVTWKYTSGLMKYGWYKRLNSIHCMFWYGFIASVAAHVIAVLYITYVH